MRGIPSVQVADDETDVNAKSDIDLLHEIGSRIAAADPLHAVLSRVVDFVSTIVQCDSCFVYVLEDDDLVLRASKTPHPDVVDRLKLRVGQGITGWVAEHRTPVAVGSHAFDDPAVQDLQRTAGGSLRGVPLGAGAVARKTRRRHQPAASSAAQPLASRDAADLDDRVPGWRRDRNRAARDRELAAVRAARDEKGPRPRKGHPAARPRAHRGRGLPHDSAAEPPAAEDEEGDRRSDHPH